MNPLNTLLAVAGLSLLIAGAAGAQGWEGHGGGRDGGHGRREHVYPPRGGDDRAVRAYAGRPTGGPAFAPRDYARPDLPVYPPSYEREARRFEPRNWGRGQFLPHSYWSGQSVDPRPYRLRTPPPGYAWYGVGRDAYLVQRSTGLILDTAPGAW